MFDSDERPWLNSLIDMHATLVAGVISASQTAITIQKPCKQAVNKSKHPWTIKNNFNIAIIFIPLWTLENQDLQFSYRNIMPPLHSIHPHITVCEIWKRLLLREIILSLKCREALLMETTLADLFRLTKNVIKNLTSFSLLTAVMHFSRSFSPCGKPSKCNSGWSNLPLGQKETDMIFAIVSHVPLKKFTLLYFTLLVKRV